MELSMPILGSALLLRSKRRQYCAAVLVASAQFDFGVVGLVLCATGLHCPIALSNWAMQGQCTEVFESEGNTSGQWVDGLGNEGRSNQRHQSPRIVTPINSKG
jgi:hypothetical protein